MPSTRPRTIRRRAQRAFAKKVERELKAHAQAALKTKVERLMDMTTEGCEVCYPVPQTEAVDEWAGAEARRKIWQQRRYQETDAEYERRMLHCMDCGIVLDEAGLCECDYDRGDRERTKGRLTW